MRRRSGVFKQEKRLSCRKQSREFRRNDQKMTIGSAGRTIPGNEFSSPNSSLTIADPGGGNRQFPDALSHDRGTQAPLDEILAGGVNNPGNDQTPKVEHQTVSKT